MYVRMWGPGYFQAKSQFWGAPWDAAFRRVEILRRLLQYNILLFSCLASVVERKARVVRQSRPSKAQQDYA